MKHLPGVGSRNTEDYINEYFDNPDSKVCMCYNITQKLQDV